jgi:hypothetical protein
MSAPPRLSIDPRIKTAQTNGPKPQREADPKDGSKDSVENFIYEINVKTPSESPVYLLSNLTKKPAPIHVDLSTSSQDHLQGKIRVTSFPLELFRRDATVEHFDLLLRRPVEESKLDGLIKVAYADYTISIMVISTLGKPTVKFLSDPPLPEDQVIATLLFGRPIEELDADQSLSVGNSRAAVADRALGLASLYALASTPIQSVDYNSKTGILTATFKLAKGMTLNVGMDSNRISEVGIRKRLGGPWTATTSLSSFDGQAGILSTFIEWVNRY